MEVIKKIDDLTRTLNPMRESGKRIGFVPTMGFLHEGHLSLVDRAKQENDVVVVSIFVNPLQFGPNEDFERYPRDLERDERLAKELGTDYLFYPDVNEMYPTELAMNVSVSSGVDVLCGKSRPGHFDGVATVVLKLFNIVGPNRAYFGMKDAQQVAVIERMITDFNLPVMLVACETLREVDGLAKSSRNVYLTREERQEAPAIYESLTKALVNIDAGERDPEVLRNGIIDVVTSRTSGVIDYVEVLSYPQLKKVDKLSGRIMIAVAVAFTKARLIDNVTIELQEITEEE